MARSRFGFKLSRRTHCPDTLQLYCTSIASLIVSGLDTGLAVWAFVHAFPVLGLRFPALTGLGRGYPRLILFGLPGCTAVPVISTGCLAVVAYRPSRYGRSAIRE